MNPLKALPAALLAVTSVAHAVQEPRYVVLQHNEVYEVRRYESYLVAEVIVPGPADDAGNQGFRILGDYIFGKNKGERKIAMTAPVSQTPVPTKIDMTAPVTQAAVDGGFLVQFVMPQGSTLATIPEPLDPRVQFREISGQTVAVIQYSGGWSGRNYEQHLLKLRKALADANIEPRGEPVFSRYNAPYVLPFLRRNEIWLNVP